MEHKDFQISVEFTEDCKPDAETKIDSSSPAFLKNYFLYRFNSIYPNANEPDIDLVQCKSYYTLTIRNCSAATHKRIRSVFYICRDKFRQFSSDETDTQDLLALPDFVQFIDFTHEKRYLTVVSFQELDPTDIKEDLSLFANKATFFDVERIEGDCRAFRILWQGLPDVLEMKLFEVFDTASLFAVINPDSIQD